MRFKNASQAYDYYLDEIIVEGVDFGDTKALFNVGFTINNPMDNHIKDPNRKWNLDYARAEWLWYKSKKPFIEHLGYIYGKIPPIWEKMASDRGFVNSNYGYQWNRNFQLDRIVEKLKSDNTTRQAVISIYDGKELDSYARDTPCTLGIVFYIIDNRLNMSVYMRSNDIWYGFCNDQFCFSMLQQQVAGELKIEIGEYYHHATNMHLYKNKL